MILLILNIILLFLLLSSDHRKSLWDVIIIVPCLFGLIILILTEAMGLFRALDRETMILCWSCIDFFLLFWVVKWKKCIGPRILDWKEKIFVIIQTSTQVERLIFSFSLVLLSLMFLSGLCYPPNNWDSMTYHMARIIHWVGNDSVNYYPTHIYRQIYQSPLMEYMVMHVCVLNQSDVWAFVIQFGFYIFSGITFIAILSMLGLKRLPMVIGTSVFLLLPEGVLQASSTQNDLVTVFYFLTALYFVLKIIKGNTGIAHFFFWGLAMGLCIQTKATGYIYLGPLIIMTVPVLIKQNWRRGNIRIFSLLLLVSVVVVLVNGAMYWRNLQFNNSLLGGDAAEREMLFNNNHSLGVITGNIVKNIGLHIGPYPFNQLYVSAVNFFDGAVIINGNGINYLDISFKGAPVLPVHEDTAYNTIQLGMVIFTLFLLFFRKFKGKTDGFYVVWLMVLLLLAFTTFNVLLKWQPWHSRLHFPFFALGIVLLSYLVDIIPSIQKFVLRALPFMMLLSLSVVLVNYTRPIISIPGVHKTAINDLRYRQYFSNKPELTVEYETIHTLINASNNNTIGVELGTEDDWEYPLFYNTFERHWIVKHILVNNSTRVISQNTENMGFIISTKHNQNSMVYEGKQYINVTSDQRMIWLYKLE